MTELTSCCIERRELVNACCCRILTARSLLLLFLCLLRPAETAIGTAIAVATHAIRTKAMITFVLVGCCTALTVLGFFSLMRAGAETLQLENLIRLASPVTELTPAEPLSGISNSKADGESTHFSAEASILRPPTEMPVGEMSEMAPSIISPEVVCTRAGLSPALVRLAKEKPP